MINGGTMGKMDDIKSKLLEDLIAQLQGMEETGEPEHAGSDEPEMAEGSPEEEASESPDMEDQEDPMHEDEHKKKMMLSVLMAKK